MSRKRRVGKAKRAHHLFAEPPLNIAKISSPIGSEQSSFDKAVEAAVRPIGYACDVAVLHRVEVNIVDVSLEIFIVANCVLPVTALPDAFLPLGNFAG